MPLPAHSQRAHDSLDWNFLLQLWYLLGLGDWKLLARCRAVVQKKKGGEKTEREEVKLKGKLWGFLLWHIL